MQAPDADGQMLAQIADVCRWYASGGAPNARLPHSPNCHITAGRTDLLARYAGQRLAWQSAAAEVRSPGAVPVG